MAKNIPPTYEDEIDLRAILQTLWKARVVILIAALVPAVAVFAINSRPSTPTYQAAAYVFIGNPPATDAAVSPYFPDVTAIAQVATAPSLLESVTQDPAVLGALGVEQVSFMGVTAVNVGRDQLLLQVTDSDPQRAVVLANAWAEKVAEMVNATYYGVGGVTDPLESQLAQSHERYEEAQTAFEETLSQSRVDALSASLQSKQADLLCSLSADGDAARLLKDLQTLEEKWDGVPGETPLSLDDALALTALRQRSLISQPCQSATSTSAAPELTLQIDRASYSSSTVSGALAGIAEMKSALQSRMAHLQAEQKRLEGEIPQLQSELEHERAGLTQFALERDQAYTIYAALLDQQQRAATALAQNMRLGAAVSVPATSSQNAASRNTIRNTLVVGMLGLALGVFGVLAVDWWRSGRPLPM